MGIGKYLEPTDFQIALAFTLQFEGGLNSYEEDKGGTTNFGISKNAYPDIDIESLTLQDAEIIYKRDYWDKQKLSSLPLPLNVLIFDFAVNSGPVNAGKALQKLVKTNQDGVIGSETIAAALNQINFNRNLELLCSNYLRERYNFIINLLYNNKTYYDKFGRGLLNRLVHCSNWLDRFMECKNA